jgi:hypothetical protein
MRSLLCQIVRRILFIGASLAVGLFVLGFAWPANSGVSQLQLMTSSPLLASTWQTPVHPDGTLPGTKGNDVGYGAGDSAVSSSQASICNPLDVACLAQAALTAILTPVTQTLTTFCDTVLKNVAAVLASPASASASVMTATANGTTGKSNSVQAASGSLNFLTQTPLCFSMVYSACTPTALDATIATFTGWTQVVASSVLTFMVVVGGFSIIIGQQMGLRVQGVSQLIPRIALTSLAAWVSPSIVQAFIDLNNLLCQGALQAAQISGLAAQISNLANPSANLLVLLFLVAVTLMAILLIGQMALRLAFVTLLGALGPLGLLCFALPQTLGWGRLWMQQFSLAVFIQFVQVAALALGGALLVALSTPTAALFAGVPDATPIVGSFLLIMLFYLAFRLPTMIQASALRHAVAEVNHATVQTIEGAGELLALLVA